MASGKRGTQPLERICQHCGAEFMVRFPSQRKRHCGRSCSVKAQSRTHDASANPNWRGGKTQHPLYDVYLSMIGRCHQPTNKRYANYGGRGIYVCDRWRNDFWAFANDVGERPAGLIPGTNRAYYSLDRIDNDGPYAPGNVRWATPRQQKYNSRERPPQERDDTTGRFVSQ